MAYRKDDDPLSRKDAFDAASSAAQSISMQRMEAFVDGNRKAFDRLTKAQERLDDNISSLRAPVIDNADKTVESFEG